MGHLDHLTEKSVRDMTIEECKELAEEIRSFLIHSVSHTGGHLSSNLGTVELTIALHKTFDFSRDKIVWDVGHQCYTHKILTGRKELFSQLRRHGGLSGFPKTEECEADCFNTGHSSTSISAALGLARARDLEHEKHRVTAVIGDGALTGGMAFEAMNDAGHYRRNFLVILNDNEMSISKNVGSLSLYLNKIRNKKGYFRLKDVVHQISRIPLLGGLIGRVSTNLRRVMKFAFVPGMFFEELGFYYVGPVDGHDLDQLCFVLDKVKDKNSPILLHVNTVKGKGYNFAQEHPTTYHCTSQFDMDKGIAEEAAARDYSHMAGELLLKEAQKNPKIVAITAAMPDSTGLCPFSRQYPERFFDVGIAEQHAVTFGAGLSKGGQIPVFAVYSSFLQRAYDQVLHDVALQKLHFVFLVDRAGIVGPDGETHQGIYDLTYLSSIPHLKILAPADFADLKQMLDYALNGQNGPVAIRYPKGRPDTLFLHDKRLLCTGCEIVAGGDDILILAVGKMVSFAFEAAQQLRQDGIRACVVNARSVKPLDTDFIETQGRRMKKIVTVEDNIAAGGFGSGVAGLFAKEPDIWVLSLGFPDRPIECGTPKELYQKYGLDADGIYRSVKEFYHEP